MTEVFECRAYDAHCPTMTVRFQVPQGFPIAGGMYRIERVRTSTPEDEVAFASYKQPVDYDEILEALEAIATGNVSPSVHPDLAVRYEKFARAAIAKARGEA